MNKNYSDHHVFFSKDVDENGHDWISLGLTKKEYYAAMAMQGFCANPAHPFDTYEEIAMASIQQAEALIKEFNK